MSGHGFDWIEDADDIVVPSQDAIACYCNGNGDIVLRRQRDWDEEDDVFIVIARQHAIAVARAILDAAGIELPCAELDGAAIDAQPTNGAIRARRYRQKKRNAPVTQERDGRDGARDAPRLVAAE